MDKQTCSGRPAMPSMLSRLVSNDGANPMYTMGPTETPFQVARKPWDVSHLSCFSGYLISLNVRSGWRKNICKTVKEWLKFFREALSGRLEFVLELKTVRK